MRLLTDLAPTKESAVLLVGHDPDLIAKAIAHHLYRRATCTKAEWALHP